MDTQPFVIRYLSTALLACASALLLPAAALGQDAAASALIERGRYLIKTSGCNDCHTPGYIMSEGRVPESLWLTGDSFGWRGAWGTTYGSNLRLFMQNMSETEWIHAAKTLKRRPPMPWFNLNAMNEDDLRAIYHFTRSLGEPGDPAPAYVPPGQTPDTAFAQFPLPPTADSGEKK